MSGHVYVVHGDVTRLACDAWLLPGGGGGFPSHVWSHAVGRGPAEPLPARFGRPGARILRWSPLTMDGPTPYLVDVGGSRGTPIAWYLDGVREFLLRVAGELAGRAPRSGRALPLVALPLVGTGMGGKRQQAGAVAQELLPLLHDFVEAHACDVALVMIEEAAYSAVQAERRRISRAFRALEPALLSRADALADRAGRGELVLFMGAGLSAGAGLPTWSALLDRLAAERAELSAEQRRHLGDMSALDRAQLIQSRLPPGISLGEAVAELFRSVGTHYGLGHGLLAALPVREAVTTNYDTLFESASRAIGRALAVLPYEPLAAAERWLLKMHGSVEHPEDIVLTRDDYLAYRERREALAGIVQALLMTRHMLFVGFSLEDENFHPIVRAVRRAMLPARARAPREEEPFGTVLMVAGNPLSEELWRGSLSWLRLDRQDGHADTPRAARRLEIFLDRLGLGASSASLHLFDARYDEVLSPAERELRSLLLRLAQEVSPEVRRTRAWGEVEALLARLGWPRAE